MAIKINGQFMGLEIDGAVVAFAREDSGGRWKVIVGTLPQVGNGPWCVFRGPRFAKHGAGARPRATACLARARS